MTVSVTRDNWGIGHASAPSSSEAFWAQGWLAASDRIWQMDWDRRRAAGRWAEVVGDRGVAEDRFFRRLGLTAAARADWASLRPETKAMTEAYAAGVNAWLEANAGRLPAEFESHPAPPERWEPWHCVVVYKVRHLFMGTFHRKLWRGATVLAAGPEVAAAMRTDPSAASAIVSGPGVLPSPALLQDAMAILNRSAEDLAALADTDGGSNSWAVHGSRTRSGKPLLAGDPHRGIEFPNVYYQCHIACSDFDVIGFAFPGVPGFAHFGHNADVAWCITHGMADDTDVFVEDDASLAAVDWRTETIAVANGESVEVRCGATPRGPVVLGDADGPHALSMMWTGISGVDTTLDALLPMLTAGSCDELEEAVRPWVIPVNSLLTADVAGDISFKIRGRVVERTPASRWTPVPGDAAHSWAGLEAVPFDALPAWRNPDRGFLVTANNRVADAGPYISLDFAGPSRHDRIVELLAGLNSATGDDMRAIHADVRSSVAVAITPLLLSADCATGLGHAAQGLLAGWNHELTPESAAATIYSASRRRFSELVAERLALTSPVFGEPGWPDTVSASRMLHEGATSLLVSDGWRTLQGLDDQSHLNALLGQAIDSACEQLSKQLGGEPHTWAWERVHTMVSPHPLASALPGRADLHPPVDGCPGDGDTVRAGAVAPAHGDRSSFASVGRYLFDLSDWDASGWVVPHGVSGERGSGHDLDQRQAWLACELVPMAYSPAAIEAVAQETFALTPALP